MRTGNQPEHLLLTAIEAHNYPQAAAAMEEYLAWFEAAPRTIEEVANARDLFTLAVQVTALERSGMEDQLTFARASSADADSGPSHTFVADF